MNQVSDTALCHLRTMLLLVKFLLDCLECPDVVFKVLKRGCWRQEGSMSDLILEASIIYRRCHW